MTEEKRGHPNKITEEKRGHLYFFCSKGWRREGSGQAGHGGFTGAR